MPAELGPLLDVILLGVLGVVMYRSWQLSRQFDKIQQDRVAFEQLIQALNIATARAEGAVHGLKSAVTEAGDQLQTKVNAARALSDELEIMVQAGDSLAERLQTLAEKSHKPASQEAHTEIRTETKPATTPRTKAEKELLEAMKAKQQS